MKSARSVVSTDLDLWAKCVGAGHTLSCSQSDHINMQSNNTAHAEKAIKKHAIWQDTSATHDNSHKYR